jgi:hypothetical protein
LAELEARDFVILDKLAGTRTTRIRLLSDAGDGSPYSVPGEVLHRANDEPLSPEARAKHVYFRVPNAMWTLGHIAKLDGPATAMLLIVLAESRGSRQPVWFSPSHADEYYGVAAATRSKGLDTLRKLEIVVVSKVPINGTAKYSPRRNVYLLPMLPQPDSELSLSRVAVLSASPSIEELAENSAVRPERRSKRR